MNSLTLGLIFINPSKFRMLFIVVVLFSLATTNNYAQNNKLEGVYISNHDTIDFLYSKKKVWSSENTLTVQGKSGEAMNFVAGPNKTIYLNNKLVKSVQNNHDWIFLKSLGYYQNLKLLQNGFTSQYFIQKNGQTNLLSRDNFMDLLTEAVNDCEQSQKYIKQIAVEPLQFNYNRHFFKSVVEMYSLCEFSNNNGEADSFKKPKTKHRSIPGLNFGMNINNDGYNLGVFVHNFISTSYSVDIGLEARNYSHVINSKSPLGLGSVEYDAKLNVIALPLGVRKFFGRNNKIQPSVLVGVNSGYFTINYDSQIVLDDARYITRHTTEYGIYFGAYAGLGVYIVTFGQHLFGVDLYRDFGNYYGMQTLRLKFTF